MTVATLSPNEFNVGLLGALNLSLPNNQSKLRRILAQAAAKQQILAKLQQVLAQKTADSKKANAAAFYPQLSLSAPPGLSLPEGFAPPPGLAPPSNSSMVEECRKKDVSGVDDYIDSDAQETTIGVDSMTLSLSEGSESDAENFQMNADAACFVPSFLSTSPYKAPSTHNAKAMTVSPVWVGVKQAQQDGLGWPKEARRQLPLTKQIKKQQQQKQQQLLEQQWMHHEALICESNGCLGEEDIKSSDEEHDANADEDHDANEATRMICNIPCKFGHDEITKAIHSVGFEGLYESLQVPQANHQTLKHKRSGRNLGYAFIQLKTPDLAVQFENDFQNYQFAGTNSIKKCVVQQAHLCGFNGLALKTNGKEQL